MPSSKPSTTRQCNVFITSGSVSFYAALICKFIEAFAYMLTALTLRPYLEENWSFNDMDAGIVYGIWGVMGTVFGVMFGPVIDKIGVRWSLLIGAAMLTVSRFYIAFTTSQTILLLNLYALLPAGQALGLPVLLISMRRYAVAAVGSITYGAVFSAQCLGFFFAGIIVDIFRDNFPHSFKELDQYGQTVGNSTKPSADRSVWLQMTAYRYINLVSAISTCVLFLIALLFVYDEEVVWVKKKDKNNPNKKKDTDQRDSSTVVRGCNISTKQELDALLGDENDENGGNRWEMQPYTYKPKGTTLEMLSSLNVKPFWTFMFLVFCTMGGRMLLKHLDLTFPVYAEREMGKHVDYGLIVAANPLSTIVFTFVAMVVCTKISIIQGIMLGMSIEALGALWLVFSHSVWAGYAFSITLGLAEAIWVPRFYELSISKTAPEGQEGMFSALIFAPTFSVKLVTGLISGHLLTTYTPKHGARNSSMMWFLIFLISATSPLLIGIFHWSCGVFDILLEKIQSSNEKKAMKDSDARKGSSGSDGGRETTIDGEIVDEAEAVSLLRD